MKLKKIFGIIDRLKLVHGIEQELLKRKRQSTIGWLIAVAAFIQQMLAAIFGKEYLNEILEWNFDFSKKFPLYQFLGIGLVVFGLIFWFLLKRTSILLKESEEPFHYTFWIEPFKRVKEKPEDAFSIKSDDLFHHGDNRFLNLLHHDLMERLNERVKRLSLIDVALLKGADPSILDKLRSHIHIEGHYTVRKETEGIVIHVMPRIRIGAYSSPSTLANAVQYRIEKNENEVNIDSSRYNQIAERVVSSIATEIYKQVDIDIKEKLKMFPTAYTRAAALYHEAKDFARSNTIDAYDRALYLYKEALRYFDISKIKWLKNCLIKLPILWRFKVKYVHLQAKVQTGCAQSLIYRRLSSSLSGRYANPIFEIPNALNSVIIMLMRLHNKMNKKDLKFNIKGIRSKLMEGKEEETDENKKSIEEIERERKKATMAFLTFPKDSWSRYRFKKPLQGLFKRHKLLLFDAFTVTALSYYFLGAFKRAKKFLDFARAIAPRLSEKNALFLFTAGAIEPDIDKEILLFSNAVEYAPDFEMAQYFLAYFSEMQFRRQDEIIETRAKNVLEEYEKVIKINHGNIAAFAAQGYIYWLLKDEKNLKKAKYKLKEGCDIKAIARETFIGELTYGLARIAAEEGSFNESHDLYTQAISASPGVAAYSPPALGKTTIPFYDYIGPSILKRFKDLKTKFEDYKKKFEMEIPLFDIYSGEVTNSCDKSGQKITRRTMDNLYSFILNDYGNACLNYFHRHGDRSQLNNAIKAFEEAVKKNPKNYIVYYNLHNAQGWRGDPVEEISEYLDKAEKLSYAWPAILIASAEFRLRFGLEVLKKELDEVNQKIKSIERKKDEVKRKLADAKKGKKGIEKAKDKKMESKKTGDGFQIPKSIQGSEARELLNLYTQKKSIENKYEKARRKVLEEVEKAVDRTKLSQLIKDLGENIKGEEVEKILERIEIDRFDDYDVVALRIWAELLFYVGEENFDDVEKISKYILEKLIPEDFDVNHRVLFNMYKRIENV